MRIRTRDGAELNGHRFKAGVVLDLPEAEAAILLDQDMADLADAMPDAPKPTVKARAKR